MAAFLDGLIPWLAIADVIDETLDARWSEPRAVVDVVLKADRRGGVRGRQDHREEGARRMRQIDRAGPSSRPEDQRHHDAEPPTNRAALFRLFLIVAAGIFAATLTGVVRTVAVIFAIVMMVMLHELGHFVTAKWAGMKVTEFFVGFGPRLWSVRKGETEYGIKAIPPAATSGSSA